MVSLIWRFRPSIEMKSLGPTQGTLVSHREIEEIKMACSLEIRLVQPLGTGSPLNEYCI